MPDKQHLSRGVNARQTTPLQTDCKVTPMLGGVREANYFIAFEMKTQDSELRGKEEAATTE